MTPNVRTFPAIVCLIAFSVALAVIMGALVRCSTRTAQNDKMEQSMRSVEVPIEVQLTDTEIIRFFLENDPTNGMRAVSLYARYTLARDSKTNK